MAVSEHGAGGVVEFGDGGLASVFGELGMQRRYYLRAADNGVT
jgi:hypothetical protein